MDEIRKISVSERALRLEIDHPANRRIAKPVGVIRGWFASSGGIELPETFAFRIGGITLPHMVVTRLDVEAVMPDHTIVGFDIPYELVSYLTYIQDNRLVIHLKLPDYDPVLLRFKVEERALAACLADAGGV